GITSAAGIKVLGTGIEVGEIGSYIKDLLNPSMVTGIVIGTLLGVGIRTPLTQYYRSWLRPEIPDVGDAMTMRRRGILTDVEFHDVLARHGYGGAYETGYADMLNVIPGIGDLITFVVREVITPADFVAWAAKQGLSEYWANSYWEAHWVLPAYGSLQEAFYRGLISPEEFDKYIVWHDYKPEPRPGISRSDVDIMHELTWHLPGRIEARWMYRWGLIDADALLELTKMYGIHPDWQKAVADAERLNQALAERTALANVYRSDVVEGLMSFEDYEGKLRELRYTPEEIAYMLEEARRRRAKRLESAHVTEARDLTRSQLSRLFELDIITEAEYRERLAKLNYAPTEIDLIVKADQRVKALAEERRLARQQEEEERWQARLTADEKARLATVLERLCENDVISQEEFRARLQALGYYPEEIGLREDIVKARKQFLQSRVKPPEPQMLSLAQLRDAWEYGLITDAEYLTGVKLLGYTDADAELVLRTGQISALRSENEAVLRAHVRQYVKGYITLEQLRKYGEALNIG
ncbi:MAG: hypothetical protein QME27_08985, partial [Syntrophaceae bacterium]|nr:hypothetical protein [Syntrophaceae bacterium]